MLTNARRPLHRLQALEGMAVLAIDSLSTKDFALGKALLSLLPDDYRVEVCGRVLLDKLSASYPDTAGE
jgi:hypothetical protein